VIRPFFYSERLLDGPPFKGCRVATLANGYALATSNESVLLPTARYKSRAGRTADLRRGWRAFESKFDSNGIPDRDDIPRICEAMFPELSKPELASGQFSFADALSAGLAISVALKLSVLPASSELRAYTSADHQVLLYGLSQDGRQTRRLDPMHGHSDAYLGEWVPLEDVRQAARPFGFLVELFPIGGWTQAKLATARLENVRDRLRKERNALEAERDALALRVQHLEAGNGVAAGWEAFGNTAITEMTRLLNEGPRSA
jgi:hypothetical protein